MPGDHLYIGLMSGTSMDGIDAALVDFSDGQGQLIHALNHPWPDLLERDLRDLSIPGTRHEIEHLGHTDAWAGEILAEATLRLLDEAGIPRSRIRAVCSHGQTIRHRPRDRLPFTLQIGDPARITERTGITTVADFRRRDIAAGGEGAPLVPAFHAAVFRCREEGRAVVNIGGIANITALPADDSPTYGFDTGPGNRLMDDWIQRHRRKSFDRDGAWAATGIVHPELLATLVSDPYFRLAPPKSTGSEYFNLQWASDRSGSLDKIATADVQATFAELTAVTIADALNRHAPDTSRLLVCGGGSHNAHLMTRLASLLPREAVETTQAFGIDPDWVEAIAFAWLGRETLAGRPGNLPAVTGARGPRILGAVYPA